MKLNVKLNVKLIFLILSCISFDAFSELANSFNSSITEISMRSTAAYHDETWKGVALITFDSAFSGSEADLEGCNLSTVYIKPNTDKEIFSALLTAKAQGITLTRASLENTMTIIGGYCRLVQIRF
ncbi:MAG: hypothetical protein V7785_08110 [Bermanella sp.]